MKVRKAVLPVAGLGTRFLPATKSIAKEMITVVDKPVIQYVVEEAAAAGIRDIVLVTHSSKGAIEDHFDVNYELESELERRGKQKLLDIIHSIKPDGVRVIAVRQGRALGLGHAVQCAREVVGDEPFAVVLPDVLVDNHGQQQNDLQHMLERYSGTNQAQVMVAPVPRERVDQYGVVDLSGKDLEPMESAPMSAMVEKPPVDQAPSNLAVVGRYVLPAEIFSILDNVAPGAGGEIQLTDAISVLMERATVEAYRMSGETYDCGSKLGYLEATLVSALRHPEVADGFASLLRKYQS